jgi:hypothetical protein
MIDQLMESIRKASESSLQIQQDMFKHWSQQWASSVPGVPGGPGDSGEAFRKRVIDMTIEVLNKHRESLETTYRSSIEVLAQSLRVSEAKSPDDYRRMIEELWGKLFVTFKDQSETQFREFQRWAEKLFDVAPKNGASQPS